MITRILAAASCCLLLAACVSSRDIAWGEAGDALTYSERAR